MATRLISRCGCFLFTLALGACGQDPSFLQQKVDPETSPIPGSTDEEGPNKKTANAEPTPGVIDHVTTQSSAEGNEHAGGADGQNGSGDATGKSSSNGSSANASPIPSLKPVPPGAIRSVKVGVNFEDLPNGDFDYNDAVLCFVGDFDVTGNKIMSIREQNVKATAFSATVCNHRVDVAIKHADGQQFNFSYSAKSTKEVLLPFKEGSQLQVTITPQVGDICPRAIRWDDPKQVKILPNLCNTGGN